jgi:hypothetical protein
LLFVNFIHYLEPGITITPHTLFNTARLDAYNRFLLEYWATSTRRNRLFNIKAVCISCLCVNNNNNNNNNYLLQALKFIFTMEHIDIPVKARESAIKYVISNNYKGQIIFIFVVYVGLLKTKLPLPKGCTNKNYKVILVNINSGKKTNFSR